MKLTSIWAMQKYNVPKDVQKTIINMAFPL